MKKLILSLVILLLMFGTTLSVFNPETSPLPVFLLIFVLGYVFICVLIALLLGWIYPKMSKTRLTFASCVLSFCPIVILALQSVGSLSILSFIIALILPMVIVWYVSRRNLTD
jgi:hypothetical protein